MTGKPVPAPWGKQLVHKKVRYSEYTDDDSFEKKPQPAWLGNLGRSSPGGESRWYGKPARRSVEFI